MNIISEPFNKEDVGFINELLPIFFDLSNNPNTTHTITYYNKATADYVADMLEQKTILTLLQSGIEKEAKFPNGSTLKIKFHKLGNFFKTMCI